MVHAFSLKCSGWRAGAGPGVGFGPPPSPSGSVSTAAAPTAVQLVARTSGAGRAQPGGRGMERRVAARVGAEAGVGRLALALRVERARQKVESECAPHLDPGRRLGLGRGRGEPRRGDEGPRADASVGGVRVDDGVDELRPLWRLDVEREPLGAHHLLERPPPLGRHLEHPACGDVSWTCRGHVVMRRATRRGLPPSSCVASSDTCGGSEGRPCRIFLYSSVVESASKGSR
mmetsp:Transcript_12934/g.41290  ORF Transcript_12934/g.41290 Transcript_12934/m.41290 type:complete len:231 (-) Transcript_12934:232-924(-)